MQQCPRRAQLLNIHTIMVIASWEEHKRVTTAYPPLMKLVQHNVLLSKNIKEPQTPLLISDQNFPQRADQDLTNCIEYLL